MSFQSVARKLEAAIRNGRDLTSLLISDCPKLVHDVRADLATSALLRLWGWSANWDELAEAPIVDPQIISAICQLGGPTPRTLQTETAVHAGVMHTYCYLFSRLKTEFGLKGDRWTKGEIAAVFDLPSQVLSGEPASGTLLTNATYLLGRIAFRGDARRMATLRRFRTRVPEEIQTLDYRKLNWTRIVETVNLGRNRQIEFRTDLVPPIGESTADWLVVYSLVDTISKSGESPVLVTAFPTREPSATEMLASGRMGKRVEVRPRYNAWVNGWPGSVKMGTRSAWQVSATGCKQFG